MSRRKKDDLVTLAADSHLSHDSISHKGLKELELMMMRGQQYPRDEQEN